MLTSYLPADRIRGGWYNICPTQCRRRRKISMPTDEMNQCLQRPPRTLATTSKEIVCSNGLATILMVVGITMIIAGTAVIVSEQPSSFSRRNEGPNRIGLFVLIVGLCSFACSCASLCFHADCCQSTRREVEVQAFNPIYSRYPEQLLMQYPPTDYPHQHAVPETLCPPQNNSPQTFHPSQLRPPEAPWRPQHNTPQRDDLDLPPPYESLQIPQKNLDSGGLFDSSKN